MSYLIIYVDDSTAQNTTLNNQPSIALAQDPQKVADFFKTESGQKAMLAFLNRNRADVKSLLGL